MYVCQFTTVIKRYQFTIENKCKSIMIVCVCVHRYVSNDVLHTLMYSHYMYTFTYVDVMSLLYP